MPDPFWQRRAPVHGSVGSAGARTHHLCRRAARRADRSPGPGPRAGRGARGGQGVLAQPRQGQAPADAFSDTQAATLPVAGLNALYAVDIGPPVLGRRVLVTGASGGLGRFAVQLAKRAGAHVTAVSASPQRARGLAEHGADDIVYALTPEGERFDLVVEGVGGTSLSNAIRRVAPRGGAADLARLVALVARGDLDTQVDLELSRRDAGLAIRALLDRRVAGKAVVRVD